MNDRIWEIKLEAEAQQTPQCCWRVELPGGHQEREQNKSEPVSQPLTMLRFCILPALVHLWHDMGSKMFIFSISELIRKGSDALESWDSGCQRGAGLELRPHKKRLLLLWVSLQLPLAQLPLFGSIHPFQSVVFYLAICQATLKNLWLVWLHKGWNILIRE